MAMWRIFPPEVLPSKLVNEGIDLFNQKKYEEAIQCFTRALEIDSGSAVAAIAWGRKGNCLVNLTRYEEAVECYDRSLEINPQFSNIWFIKGFVLDSLGRIDEALACYDRALEINPDFPLAWKAKGDLLFSKGMYEKAEQCYARAVELNPSLEEKVATPRAICEKLVQKAAPVAPPAENPATVQQQTAAAHPTPSENPIPIVEGDIGEMQLYEETIRRFLTEMEKSQVKIARQAVAHDIRELKEQVGSGRDMIRELLEIADRQEELIAKMGMILELQSSFIERLLEGNDKT